MSIDLSKLESSASMEITNIANVKKQKGEEVFTLSIGDTHFSLAESISKRFNKLPELSSHYSSGQGIYDLRKSISKEFDEYHPEDVLVVPGLKQGFYYALEAINKNKLVVLEPAWLGYKATAVLSGYDYLGINSYKKDWLSKLSSADIDVLLLCEPNNPDGKLFTKDSLIKIKTIVEEKNSWIILDIIYERFLYDNNVSELLNLFKDYPKLIIGNGFSKSHAMTGFRLGYLLSKNQDLINLMVKIQQNLATCPSTFAQYLIAPDINPPEINDYVTYYSNNRREVLNIFPEWKDFLPDGGFYYFVDLRVYDILDAEKFCLFAINKHGIALVPGAAYGSDFNSYVRISFSLETKKLIKGLKKLKYIINLYNE